MEHLPAKLFSLIFHPIVVFSVAVLALSVKQDSVGVIGGLVFLAVGGLFPLATLLAEYFDTETNRAVTRTERNSVYIAGVISFAFTTIVFGSELFASTLWMYISMLMSIYFALALLINIYYDKISQHVAVYVLWVVILMNAVDLGLGILLAAVPVVVWARVSSRAHTWTQIFWGLFIGLVVGLLSWVITI